MQNLAIIIAVLAVSPLAATKEAESNVENLEGSFSMPGLRRPFTLGALYDAKRDEIVAGPKLWDKASLEKNVEEHVRPFTDIDVISRNTLQDKRDALELGMGLQINILAGLVEVEGAAEYLKQQPKSHHEVELSLKYVARTHVRTLSMEHLAHVEHPQVFTQEKEATHVVSQIVYGANAIFTFTAEAKNESEIEALKGNLSVSVNLVVASGSGNGSIDFTDEQKKEMSSFKCTFTGDVALNQPPTTLLEAVEAFKTLPSLVSIPTAVPVKVSLYPLGSLEGAPSRMIRQISANLLSQVERRMNAYNELSQDVGDLKMEPAYLWLFNFRAHVKDFEFGLQLHLTHFRIQLLKVLPQIRGKGLEEVALAEVLSESDYPSLTTRKLQSWVISKKREAGILSRYIAWKPQLIMSEAGEIEEVLNDYEITYVVALTLMLYPETDDFVNCLTRMCIESGRAQKSWSRSRSLGRSLRKTFSKFQNMVEYNEIVRSPRGSSFVISELYMESPTDEPSVTIEIYDEGELMEDNFQPPEVVVDQTTPACFNTEISWSMPDTHNDWLKNGQYYVIHKKFEDEKWQVDHSRKTKMSVNTTPPMEVVVLARCRFGVCGFEKAEIEYGKEPEECGCKMSAWTSWTRCSVSCGGGEKTRTRRILANHLNCKGFSKQESDKCSHDACPTTTTTTTTTTTPAPARACQLTQWTGWSACTTTCADGVKSRTRSVVAQAANGGKPCTQMSTSDKQHCDPGNKQFLNFHRLFNQLAVDHLYTTNPQEVSQAERQGYNQERKVVGQLSACETVKVAGVTCKFKKLYRMFHSSWNDHFYTLNPSEVATFRGKGYVEETSPGYCSDPADTQRCGATAPLYRLYHDFWKNHYYGLAGQKLEEVRKVWWYTDEGITCYIKP